MPLTDAQEIAVLQMQVKRLEAQIQFLYQHLAIPVQEASQFGADSEVVENLKKGDMMGAITAHRRIHNTSLPDAKKAVEFLYAQIRG